MRNPPRSWPALVASLYASTRSAGLMVRAWLTDSFDAGPKAQAGPERCTRSPGQPAWATIPASTYAVIALVNRTSRCTALTRSTPDLRSAAASSCRPRGPWQTVEQVEIAIVEYAGRFNHQRLYRPVVTSRPRARSHLRQSEGRPHRGRSRRKPESPETPVRFNTPRSPPVAGTRSPAGRLRR